MASIPGFRFDITGASGSQGLLSPKSSYRAYILPRGGHASADSTGTLITFDSASVASRFAVNNWLQAGLLTANIRQVSAVGGNSISVSGAALTITENDRIFLIGNTQPTVTGGSATYTTPNTRIYQRDDDGADLYTNSMITSNSDGLIQGWAGVNYYDAIIQDGNQSNQGSIVDMEVGSVDGVSTSQAAVFGATVTINGALGVTGTAVFGATLSAVTVLTSVSPVFDVRHATYGALGDSSTDDATGIRAAALAVNTNGGGVLFFPEGTYIVGSSITIYSNTIVRGVGWNSKVRLASAANTVVFNLSPDASGIRFENIEINGNRTNQTGSNRYGIYGLDQDDFSMDNVHVLSTRADAVRLDINSGDYTQRARITNNYFSDCGEAAVYLVGAQDCQLNDNIIYNWGVLSNTALAIGGNSTLERLTIADNVMVVDSGQHTFAIETVPNPTSVTTPRYMTITGNVIRCIGGTQHAGGISIPNCADVVISDNVIYDGNTTGTNIGSYIEVGGANATATPTNIVIRGNAIQNGGVNILQARGVIVSDNIITHTVAHATSGIATGQTISDILIDGNVIINVGDSNQSPIQLGQANTGTMSRCTISGNLVHQSGGKGIRIEPTGLSELLIFGNRITGSATHGIRVNGTSFAGPITIKDNYLLGNTSGAFDFNATGVTTYIIGNIPNTFTQIIGATTDIIAPISDTINIGSIGTITIGSTPSIFDGYDGQKLRLIGVSGTVSLQRESGLAGSNLRLGATPRAIAQYDILDLEYNSTNGEWSETAFVNNT